MKFNYQEFYQWRWSKDANVTAVFLWIILHAGSEGKVECSLKMIENDTNLTARNVRTAISKLDGDGIITQETSKKATKKKSIITVWRFVDYKATTPKKVTKKTAKKKDFTSFVAPEHLGKWNEWLKYKSSRRELYSDTCYAKQAYDDLISISIVKVTDRNGIETSVIDDKKLAANIDFSIAKNWKGLFEDKKYGNNSNHNNTGRTTQQDAERIAARHALEAAQSSISEEENRRRMEEEFRLFQQTQELQ